MKRLGLMRSNKLKLLFLLFWCIMPLKTSLAENLSMEKKSQRIAFIPPEQINTGKKLLVLDASASSGLPVTFTSGNRSVAQINGDTLLIRSAGEVSITASQSGDENWDIAKDVTWVINIKEDKPLIPEKPAVHSNVNLKERTMLIASGVAFLTGTIVSLILAGSNDDNAGNPNINDRPPGDPVMGSMH